MSRKDKLLLGICANPRDVRFDDACKAAEMLGFTARGGKGSHHGYARPGDPLQLNFQNRKGKIPPYQGRQLAAVIEQEWTMSEQQEKP